MSNTLTMSKKEIKRISILEHVCEGSLTRTACATQLGLSERQVYRLVARFEASGEAGLVHGLRGRPSNARRARSVREEVLRLYQQGYSDYGPTLFCEELAKRHGRCYDHETVRRWLVRAGLWKAATRKHPHRQKRPRRSAFGELVQFDGSFHDWFEGRGQPCVLLHAIDDASNQTFLRFASSENTMDCMRTMWMYIETHGIPKALYVDGGSVYRDDTTTPTQFARAMDDLGVDIIPAHSPQAKGRVERGNRTHQDRLIKAMRQEKIRTIDAANAFLETTYLKDHNARFAHTDGLPNVHADPSRFCLDTIFSIQETRVVANDYTIQLDGRYIQLLIGAGPLPPPKRYVNIRRDLKGVLHIAWKEHELAFKILKERPRKAKHVTPIVTSDHQWLKQNQRVQKRTAQEPSRKRVMTPP